MVYLRNEYGSYTYFLLHAPRRKKGCLKYGYMLISLLHWWPQQNKNIGLYFYLSFNVFFLSFYNMWLKRMYFLSYAYARVNLTDWRPKNGVLFCMEIKKNLLHSIDHMRVAYFVLLSEFISISQMYEVHLYSKGILTCVT